MLEKFPEQHSVDSMEGVSLLKGEERKENPEDIHQTSIVELTPDRWEQYKALRLWSAVTEPQAWGKSVHSEPEQDETYWRTALGDPHFKMFAIEMDGAVVAMAGLQQKPNEQFYLRRVYALPEMRGSGMARALIEKVFEEAKSRGAKRVSLGVTEGMPAINLYKSAGFKEVGKSKGKIRGDGTYRDEVLMEKILE